MKQALLDSLYQDFGFAVRTLRKTPGFVIACVLSLGVSLAAVATMFAVVQAADFEKLPFKDADRLVTLGRREPPQASCSGCLYSPYAPLFGEWRDRTRSYLAVEASRTYFPELRNGDDRQTLSARAATIGFLPMLGVAPIIGRGFIAGDTAAGAPHVALLSHALWQTRFGGDRTIVGKSIPLIVGTRSPSVPPEAYVVIGVLPPGFTFNRAQLWTPLDHAGLAAPTVPLNIIARLRPGATVEAADLELRAIDNAIETGRRPGRPRGIGAVESLKRRWMDEQKTAEARFALLGVSAAVLLLATLNIGGLALARVSQRRVELAIRGALGASRSRVVRLLAVEMSIVTLTGGVVALLAVGLSVGAVSAHFSLEMLGVPARVDYALIATILVLVLAIGFGLALLAAGQASRVDVATTLRNAGTVSQGRGRLSLRQLLIGGELALTLSVLAAAGLMGKELVRIITNEIEFDSRNLITILVWPGGSPAATDPAQVRALSRAAVSKLAPLPGVVDASATSSDMARLSRVQPNGREIGESEPVLVLNIWPNFFRTIGLPVVQGRPFSSGDNAGSDLVVMVNRKAARRLWPLESPLGKRVTLGSPGAEESATVVGIVGDYEVDGVTPPLNVLYFYRPITQGRPLAVRAYLRVRTMDPATIGAIRRATVELRGDAVGVDEIVPLQRSVDADLAGPRFNTAALTALAAFSLFLAALGVYGIVTSTVVERTREIGIRMALGATPRAVLQYVSRHTVVVIAVGTLVGVAGAFATTRLLKSMLFGTSPTDPLVFVAAPLVLAVVAAIAMFVPARRATRLDPVSALRSE